MATTAGLVAASLATLGAGAAVFSTVTASPAAAATIPTVTCTTDPVIFNTGYNTSTGGQTANGAPDERWTVAGGVDGLNHSPNTPPQGPLAATLPPAGTTYVDASVGKANNLWADSLSGESQWISANYVVGQNQSNGYGTWYYRYQFNLDPAVDPASFQLKMNWMADNSVNAVWVNDQPQTGDNLPQSPDAPYQAGGFLAGNEASTTMNGPWQTGLNTILVQVASYYVAEGFNAEVESVALCPDPSYTLAKTASTTSTAEGGVVNYNVAVTNTGNVPYTAEEPASFSDDLSGVLDDATYNGDASNGATVSGTTLNWSGAIGVGETVNITYSVTVNDPDTGDHALTNTVIPTDETGSCISAADCTTTTLVSSYNVAKSVDATEVIPGSTVTYTVTVTNTGQVAYTDAAPATFTDDLSQVADDATYNNDATNGATITGNTLSWSGALAVGETKTITYSFTVNDPDTGDKILSNAVVPGDTGRCEAGECTTQVPSGAYTVAKTSNAATTTPGGTVTYTVTVTNTGQIAYTDAKPASFTDDLSKVLDDATYNGDATNGATVSGSTLSWQGALAIGASTTITYSVTVNDPDTGDHTLTNVVVPNGPGGDCETVGGCTTTTQVASYATKKTVDAASVSPGGTVTYTVTVTNTGQVAYTDAAPATFTDDLSQVADDATYNGDATNGATVQGNTLSWSGALAVGATTTITYSFTVNDPATGDKILTNAVVPGEGGDCVTPGDCGTTTNVASFTTTKTADKSTVKQGDTVRYTVTVTNTGQAAYTDAKPAGFTDDLSKVTDDAAYNNDGSVTYSAGSSAANPTLAGTTLSWSGPLQVGEIATITYSVTVNTPDTGDHVLTNAVLPTGDGGDCDPEGSCTTDTGVSSYSVDKTVDATTVVPGATVTYTLTVKNTGKVAYTAEEPITLTDDFSQVADDATYNGDAGNGATVSGNTLTWSGPLAVGATTTVTYSFTVNDPATGDKVLRNAVVPNDPTACLVGTCGTQVPSGSFSATKTVDKNSASEGNTVKYTVTVSNTGQVAYTNEVPAGITDDLSKVLDDATYAGDAAVSYSAGSTAAKPTVSGNTLSWSGPLLVGETATITYSVTVNTPDTGDRVLANVVMPNGQGGECATAADCSTSTSVVPPAKPSGLASTGANVGAAGAFAALAALLGAGVVLIARRRKMTASTGATRGNDI
jgi:uncharacterized repeat protein (TIGR01451 family)